MQTIKLDIDADGVAVATIDLADRSMNVMTAQFIDDFEAVVERIVTDDAIKGAVITSGKPDFMAGADLSMMAAMKAEAEAAGEPAAVMFGWAMRMHNILRKLELGGAKPGEGSPKPVAAALPGTALGGGFEIPLATHRIFVADKDTAQIGLPEAKVGLLPGAGGTTRLPRLIGVMAAAPLLLEGKSLSPAKAKASGLVHEVVAPDALVETAKAWVRGASPKDTVKPWDAKGYKLPGGGPFTPQGFQTFLAGVAMLHEKTYNNYPQQRAIMHIVYEGTQVPFDTALKIEARWFTWLMLDPRSGAMVRTLFVNAQALKKGARRPAGVGDMRVKKLGVLGAGLMGSGIANVAAQAGIEVVLLDRSEEDAQRGCGHIAKALEGQVKKRRMSEAQAKEVLARVAPGADYAALSGCDLIIEAVFEDAKVKADVTQRAEAAAGPAAIFASNTSTIPITALAQASARPERFIGAHFFSPAERMPLVEIIRGEKTGDEAVAKALDFARAIGKTPIVVNDARFFYANRCIIPYVDEAHRMVVEGVKPALVENGAKMAGMPLGPLALNDETALDLGQRIRNATRAAMGDAYVASPAEPMLDKLVELGRIGKKVGKGFYDHPAERGQPKRLWPGLAEIAPPAAQQPDVETVKRRLLYIQALEAIRSLEEGCLTDVREGDVGAIFGWGFAPWSGGPFSLVDMIGPAEFQKRCEALAKTHGDRFAPPPLLRDVAAKGDSFYARFAGDAGKQAA